MNKVLTRWKDIGIWRELSALKRLFVEPSNNSELLLMMEEYREVIRESSSISFRQTSGAIFFAVFRGKVAEGIDFKDNEARCVLAVSNAHLLSTRCSRQQCTQFCARSTQRYDTRIHTRSFAFTRSAYRTAITKTRPCP